MIQSIHYPHQKPASTPGNHTEPQQLRLALIGEVPGLYLPDPSTIEHMDFDGALLYCVMRDGRPANGIAKAMGIETSKGYLSKLLNGLWHEQWRRLCSFVKATGCAAPFQLMVADMRRLGFNPDAYLAARIARLEAQVVFLTAQLQQRRQAA